MSDWVWQGALLVGLALTTLLLTAAASQLRVFPTVNVTPSGWEVVGDSWTNFEQIAIDGTLHRIDPTWLLESPGHARDAQQLKRMYEGEALLLVAARAVDVELLASDGARTRLTFATRGLADLGPRFWIPFLTGFTVYLFALLTVRVAGASWETFFLWTAATGYFVAIGLHGWHSDRPWAGQAFIWAFAPWTIVIGSSLSSWGLVSLLWVAPRRLGRPEWAAVACALIALGDALAVELHGTAAPHRFVLGAGLLALAVLFAMQWQRSRGRLVARVALRWSMFTLIPGLVIALTVWAGFVSQSTLPRWNNLALIGYGLLMIGMNALVVRQRLYLIEEWFRPALAALLAVMSAFLVLGLGFAWSRSVSAPLVLCALLAAAVTMWGVLYVNRRLSKTHTHVDTHALLPDLLRVSQADAALRSRLWLELNCKIFACSGRIRHDGDRAHATSLTSATAVDVRACGARLRIAAAGDALPAIELQNAREGTALFTPKDAATVYLLRTLVQQGVAANDAFRSGAHSERKRIAADLHDDIGGRLLSLAQRLRAPHEARYVRDALADLRTMTHALGGDSICWGERLADLRWDLTERARNAGASLHWQLDIDDATLASKARTEASVSLGAIGSELLRNAIEHATPSEIFLSISNADRAWLIHFQHAAPASDSPWSAGFGMNSIRRRISELGGSCQWHDNVASPVTNAPASASASDSDRSNVVFIAQIAHTHMVEI